MLNRPTWLILHHSEATYPHDIEEVRLWHTLPKPPKGEKPISGVHGNGWNDVGYQYFLRKSGERQKGREEWVKGAHTWRYNGQSIGVCMEGNFDIEVPTYEQVLEFLNLCANIMKRHPMITPDRIRGHRECASRKTCPGINVDLDRLRQLVKTYQENLFSLT